MRKIPLLFAALLLSVLTKGMVSAPPVSGTGDAGYGIETAGMAVEHDFDFDKREAMIPMRDGVRLYTIVLVPHREEKMPILMTRTPYGASVRSTPDRKPRLKDVLGGGDDVFADAGYIRVFQDVRGRFRSEGEYRMTLPLRGPLNPSSTDHSTDTYDTIQWLLENIPECNGRVAMIGTSYDGLLVLMGLVDPHPALKAAVPIDPMVDGWRGDDWFHNGAFRQMTLEFLKLHYGDAWTTGNSLGEETDDYDFFLDYISAGGMARYLGITHLDFWKCLLAHPSYDAFWKNQALDSILASRPLTVPTLYVHGLWDQEDIYGSIAVYRAMEKKDIANDRNFIAIGPWSHGGSNGAGYSLGPIKFNEYTGRWFRQNILLPFLNAQLKEAPSKEVIPPVLAFETGTNTWHRYNAWPLSCESGCDVPLTPMYLQPRFGLDFVKPKEDTNAYDSYVSDPLTPVPYRQRPIRPVFSRDSTWSRWLVDNQAPFASRADVLSYRTGILTRPVEISGLPIANLYASTSGTDIDFVVKLIDVYPDSNPEQPELAGYQLMISADIFRGRYREDPGNPSPVSPGRIEPYRWTLPAAEHTFLPGHRIMIQIQSTWFPLYDRNPQTYVKNIFNAAPDDYRKATQKIFHSGAYDSFVELPVVKGRQQSVAGSR
jgi:putative CocE/NonD family hydrolase